MSAVQPSLHLQPHRLRILALNWRCLRHPKAGGAEKNIFQQAQRWAAEGHQVTIITADPGRSCAPDRKEVYKGITVLRMGGTFSVYVRAALYILRHGRRFDSIVDISNGVPFFTPLLTRTPRILMVNHVHRTQWVTEMSPVLGAIGRFLEHRVAPRLYRRNHVLAISPTTRDDLIDIGYRPEQIRIVYCGITPAIPDVFDIPHDPCRVIYVGRLKSYKRVDHAIRAVAALRPRFPAIHLDIVGDGDALPSLQLLVGQLGLHDAVTFHGFVDERTKSSLIRRSTVLAMPSEMEGWGLSVVEANTYGCPTVAYNVPGLRASIKHGQTGLLVENYEAFCDALGRVLGDQRLRAHLSTNALTWSARFSWDTAAERTLHVLHVCAKRRHDLSTAPHVMPADEFGHDVTLVGAV